MNIKILKQSLICLLLAIFLFMLTPIRVSSLELSDQIQLPESYDGRQQGFITKVKNQLEHGTCTFFSAISTLESFLLKNSFGNYNFSERHASYWALPDENNFGWQRATNDFKKESAGAMAAAGYLASNGGPKLEADIPFNPFMNDTKPANMNTSKTQFDVEDIVFFDNTVSKEEIKHAIYKYGAITAGLEYNEKFFSINYSSYCLPNNIDYDKTKSVIHSVSVIGWDDNYSKNNFNFKPESNGAWLVKNSWGTEFGDSGYFWISYEDIKIFKADSYNFSIASVREQKDFKFYQHDEYGATKVINLRSNTNEHLTLYNIYDFTNDYSLLDSVRFFTLNSDAPYELYYVPVNIEGVPVTDKNSMIKLKEGIIDHPGYNNVKIENFKLPEGKGSIALKIKTEDKIISIGVESTIWRHAGSEIEYVYIANTEKGSCFINDGTSIKDVHDKYPNCPFDFSIKAITERTSQIKTGWHKINNEWYYYLSDGSPAKSWVNIKEKWYYFDESKNTMKVGWQFIKGHWYYLNDSGEMKTGWLKDDDNWYYLDPVNGNMKKDWLFEGNNWYYLDPIKGEMRSGWVNVSDKWYYFSVPNGVMQTGWITDGGTQKYFLNSSGALEKY